MYYLAPLPAPSAVAAIAEAAGLAAASESSLKRNLKWKMHQGTGMPSLTLPTVTADDDFYLDPRLAMSPGLPGGAAGFMASQTAASFFNPLQAAFGLAACNPGISLRSLGPDILRSHVPTAQYKAIPHNDEIDLEAFRRKDPREWNMDDVIGWMISVAKRRGIPVEDMNMHRFATCTGPLLTLMSQQNFIERDANYGALLYVEFRKQMGDDGSSFLDEWIRTHKDELEAGSSGVGSAMTQSAANSALLSSLAAAASEAVAAAAASYGRMVASDQPCTSRQADDFYGRSSSFVGQRESVIKAAGSSTNLAASSSFAAAAAAATMNQLGSLPDLCKLQQGGHVKTEAVDNHCDGLRYGFKFGDCLTRTIGGNGSSASAACTIPKFPDGKIKKKLNDGSCSLTISGKPRKRSQHTRGNKLWEFIRTALRDQRTCPSVVKWEDEREGVFRIVESEKLARLWGEKKNNQKMTYEKLSRAMRTYYEKQILVPVPKTGLYPKKLVYKFGPNAKGWQNTTPASIMSSSGIPKTNGFNIQEKTATNKFARPIGVSMTMPTNVPFPMHPHGIPSMPSPAAAAAAVAQSRAAKESAALMAKAAADSVSMAAAASGLMSLADVASRQLAATTSSSSLLNTGNNGVVDMNGGCDEMIDVDGRSDAGDCVSAIEETLVNCDDDENEMIDEDYDDDEIDEDDAPPALLQQ